MTAASFESHPLQVLCVGRAGDALAASAFGPFRVEPLAALADAAARLVGARGDAWLLSPPDRAALDALAVLPRAALAVPVVVLVPDLQPADAVALARLGVQDVLPADADVAEVGRSLRLAVERRAIEQAARRAFATDLATGLPSEAQLREHATQLLALREREPAPMALIVLRLDGLAAVADALGAESAQVLRRKAAVRLRAGLRASDVVASLGADAFAVLLAWIVSPADGARVAGKLARSLAQPLAVAGRSPRLGVSVGLASFPEQGSDFDSLLRRALAQAASVATGGATGLAGAADRGPDAAANDGD